MKIKRFFPKTQQSRAHLCGLNAKAYSIVCSLTVFLLAVLAQADEFSLVPGDELRIFVPGADPPEQLVQIDPSGNLDLGINGKVHVAGVPLDQAEELLKTHLRKYLRSVAGVTLLLNKAQRTILITGRVAHPGLFTIAPTTDLWQAVAEAGGVIAGGDLTRVVISRKGLEIPVNVRAYLTRESIEPLPALRAGDVVFIPAEPGFPLAESGETAFLGLEAINRKVFVLGAVEEPGIFDRSRVLDVLSAVALANGPTPTADLSHTILLTDKGRITVDLQNALGGGVSGKQLLPENGGAIIYVPTLAENLDTRLGAHINVIGSFVRQGRIPVSGPLKLIDVVGLAGGPDESGQLDEVTVVEDGAGFTLVSRFDLKRYIEKGGLAGRAMVNPGSTVYLGRRDLEALQTALQAVSTIAVVSTAVALWITVAQND